MTTAGRAAGRLLLALAACLLGAIFSVTVSDGSVYGYDGQPIARADVRGIEEVKASPAQLSIAREESASPVGASPDTSTTPAPFFVAPRVTTGLTRNADGLFGSNVTQLRTRTSGGFVRDAGGPVQVFQSEVAGGRSAAQQFFEAQVGRAPNAALATDVAEVGGLRYTIRGSSHGAPTVEVFDVTAATVEKIRFLE